MFTNFSRGNGNGSGNKAGNGNGNGNGSGNKNNSVLSNLINVSNTRPSFKSRPSGKVM